MNKNKAKLWVYPAHQLLAQFVTCVIMGILAAIGDFVLKYMFRPSAEFFGNIFQMAFVYSIFSFFILYYSLWVLPLIISESIYRILKLPFRLYQIIIIIIAFIIAEKTKNETFAFYIYNEKKAKHIIVILMGGLAYPYISNYIWGRLTREKKTPSSPGSITN